VLRVEVKGGNIFKKESYQVGIFRRKEVSQLAYFLMDSKMALNSCFEQIAEHPEGYFFEIFRKTFG
jgi:hypothetical protein